MPADPLSQLLADLWPVRIFDRCPVRTALWCAGLQLAELDRYLVAAAMQLLDAVRTSERC